MASHRANQRSDAKGGGQGERWSAGGRCGHGSVQRGQAHVKAGAPAEKGKGHARPPGRMPGKGDADHSAEPHGPTVQDKTAKTAQAKGGASCFMRVHVDDGGGSVGLNSFLTMASRP